MTVDSAIIAQLQDALRGLDRELCGALVGDRQSVAEVWPLDNHSIRDRDRFFIPASEVLRVEEAAHERGLQLVGFYHTHLSGAATPSRLDLEQAVPGYIYLIVAAHEARAWRLRDDRASFTEIELTT